MTLTDEQKSAVTRWLEAGAGLSEVQKRLREEFQVSLTYLDTRLLVDDLKLTPKDPEPELPVEELSRALWLIVFEQSRNIKPLSEKAAEIGRAHV